MDNMAFKENKLNLADRNNFTFQGWFITQVIDTPGRLYYNINVCIQSIEDPLAPDLYIEIVLLY
ncbi:hypothetical protein EQM05_14420 [Clostridium sp. JN-9]|nr:hypothetical protein EQM05_14420 [Clostridium sp. JN-9]